jgi:hypothetical protein
MDNAVITSASIALIYSATTQGLVYLMDRMLNSPTRPS